MANVGAKIVPNGSDYCILVNRADNATATDYTLNVNGKIYGTSITLNGSATFTTSAILLWRDGTVERAGMGYQSYAASTVSNQRFYFRENKVSTSGTIYSYSEYYLLPTPTGTASNAHSYFSILTSKNVVTVAQGGTGATTSADARTNLGITPANIGAKATQTAVSDPAYDGASLTFIDTISQNAQGVISPHKASIKLATESNNGIVSIATQTFAGEKHFLEGIHSYSNIRMKETVNNSTAVYFSVNNASTATTDHRLFIHEYPYNSSGTRVAYYERYSLPTPANTITTNQYYFILTSKNAVTIAQGGTGATTSANARTNLGLGTAATHAHGDYVTITDDQNISGLKTFTNSIDIQTAYGYLRWKKSIGNKDITALISANNATTTSPARFWFYQYILDSSGNHITNNVYERFSLPAVTTTRTESKDFNILTTKEYTLPTTWRAATSDTSGVVSTGAQVFAGQKTFNGDIELNSGLYIKDTGYGAIWWKKPNLTTGSNALYITAGGLATNSSAPYLYVTEYAYTTAGARSTYYEVYRFPSPAASITANATYDIWTTKNYYATSSTSLTYVTNSHCDSTNLGYLRVDRSGRMAVLTTTTALALKAYSSSAWIQIGTVPAGYRPIATTTVRIPLSSGNYMFRINTSGSVQIYKTTNETSNAYFSIPWRIA